MKFSSEYVLWFNLAAGNWDHAAAHLLLPISPSAGWRGSGQKLKFVGWDKDSLIRQQKK